MRVARPEDINRLQAGVAAAKAEQVKAEADYKRTQQLYLNDNASKADLASRVVIVPPRVWW